ncbi:hypothetical protein Bbelb_028190 [Branchiostoma belcheri]|nr:hypothetical protein Bbelb_028190 [Branchiostoma belcheri]
MHATADGQACRADHVRTPCATVRVTYSLGRPPYVCRKNVADVATTKTYGQKASTASCDRRLKLRPQPAVRASACCLRAKTWANAGHPCVVSTTSVRNPTDLGARRHAVEH